MNTFKGLDMILVMGVTGAGKSRFVNAVAGRTVSVEGNQLSSCTTDCQAVPVEIGGTKVVLVDTPGFDDPDKSDSEVLVQISTVLAALYKIQINLKGVIYLYRISDIRHTRGTSRAVSLFTKICGDQAFDHVVLATTRWDKVSEAEGARHESELRSKFWKHMLANEAKMCRLGKDRDSACALVGQVLKLAGGVVLELQKEMVDGKKDLKNTAAGSLIDNDLLVARQKHREELDALENMKRRMVNASVLDMQDTLDGIDREKEEMTSVEADQRKLEQNVADDVQAKMESQARKSRAKRNNLPGMISAAVGVLGLFFNLDPTAKQELMQWFSELGDWISGIFT